MSDLTLGSLFDGSGGFPLGGMLAGISPVWASEIEPFPIRVTTKRLPFMKHYGDISQMDGGEIEPVDIITFGSPCQDMSVAGKRSGLDGARSGLFYEAVRVIKEMRCRTDGKYPRYIVWENVPGAFSSNKGEDLRCVLESICRIKDEELSVPRPAKWPYAGEIMGDGFSVAWRQFDAQYWGIPQRRKRIYLVADLDGGSAGEILFESEGLSGYTPQGFRPWQEPAGDPASRAGEAGQVGVGDHPSLVFENHSQDCRYRGPDDISQTVSSTFGMGGNNQPFVVETPKTLKIRCGKEGGGKGPLIQDNKSATLSCNNDQTLFEPKSVDCRNIAVNEEKSGTLQAKNTGGHSLNYINPVVYGICSKDSNAMKSANPDSGFYEAKTTRCLDANGGNPSCNQGGMAVVALEGNGSRPSHHGDGYKEGDAMYTLNATEQHGVAYSSSKASFFTEAEEELANCLVATDYKDPPLVNDRPAYGFYPQMKAECVTMTEEKSGCLVNGTNPGYQNGVIEPDYIVRRLTPTECARLQGFPDWWCDDLGTEHPTDAEVYEWYKIFETHRRVTGSGSKPKTDKQIRAFLKDPHSDSAEYKMWGNGVALPCVYFVLSGIVWTYENSAEDVQN